MHLHTVDSELIKNYNNYNRNLGINAVENTV